MTTIATDGKSMAADGMAKDHCDTIVSMSRPKVFRLSDGRIIGAAGNSFDIDSWRDWLECGKIGDCPIESDQFAALILHATGAVHWVDHKGREIPTPTPCSVGSGQDVALGAMEAGANAFRAVQIACLRDPFSGGEITEIHREPSIAMVEAA